MTTQSSLASAWLILFRLLEVHGVDAQSWLRELGIDPDLARQPGARIPSSLSDLTSVKSANFTMRNKKAGFP